MRRTHQVHCGSQEGRHRLRNQPSSTAQDRQWRAVGTGAAPLVSGSTGTA